MAPAKAPSAKWTLPPLLSATCATTYTPRLSFALSAKVIPCSPWTSRARFAPGYPLSQASCYPYPSSQSLSASPWKSPPLSFQSERSYGHALVAACRPHPSRPLPLRPVIMQVRCLPQFARWGILDLHLRLPLPATQALDLPHHRSSHHHRGPSTLRQVARVPAFGSSTHSPSPCPSTQHRVLSP